MRVRWRVHVAPNWRRRPIIGRHLHTETALADIYLSCRQSRHQGGLRRNMKWVANSPTHWQLFWIQQARRFSTKRRLTTSDKSKSSTTLPFALIAGLSLSKRGEKEEGKWDSWKTTTVLPFFSCARERESIQFPYLSPLCSFRHTHPSPLWLLSNQLAQALHFLALDISLLISARIYFFCPFTKIYAVNYWRGNKYQPFLIFSFFGFSSSSAHSGNILFQNLLSFNCFFFIPISFL